MMSKIYEALQKAQEDGKELEEAGLHPLKLECPVDVPTEIPDLRMETEMLMLYHNIGSLLPEHPRKVIQFIGSRPGEGTSTIVREFANMSAAKLGKSVLVVDADHDNPLRGSSYGIAPASFAEDALVQSGSIEHCVHQTRHRNVFVSPVSRNYGSFIQRIELDASADFFEQLRLKYDLILVDSPPASRNPLGFAFCRKVDGVVLVVEAERTRWPVAESVKNRVIGCGGRMLGVVLNKRRYSIPEAVYSRL